MKDELAFANNMRAISGQTPSESGWLYLLILSILILAAGLWAHWAVLDEVMTGEGKVVPTSRLQVVQAWDGGVVRTIHVRDGDLVDKGQILLTLDDRDARSSQAAVAPDRTRSRAALTGGVQQPAPEGQGDRVAGERPRSRALQEERAA